MKALKFIYQIRNRNKNSKKVIIDLENCIALEMVLDQNHFQLFV